MKILMRNHPHDHWKLVDSVAYGQESVLQHLLSDSPSLISIQEVREGASELLVAIREFPLPIGSIDLLAFNAEGDIAIIECKLASNSEVKRTVIGQVLEYGANLWGLGYDELDEKVRGRTGGSLIDLMKKVVIVPEWNAETFRKNVEAGLREGNFILMIVVDEINEELSRIVRFLNACGQPAFSFAALEMRRFQSEETEMLIPRVFGTVRDTSESANHGRRRKWDEQSFFEAAKESSNRDAQILMYDLYQWSITNADEVHFGSGSASGSYSFYLIRNGLTGSIFSVFSNGNLMINFGYMSKIFSVEEIDNFRKQLKLIPSMKDAKNISQSFFTMGIEKAISKTENRDRFMADILELKQLTQKH